MYIQDIPNLLVSFLQQETRTAVKYLTPLLFSSAFIFYVLNSSK